MMNGICCMRSFHSFHAELIIQEMCCYAHECSHFSISPNPMWQKHFGPMRTSQSIELLQQRTNQEVLLQKSIFLSMINMTFLTNELAILICRGLVHVGWATRIPEARVSRLTTTAFESSRVRRVATRPSRDLTRTDLCSWRCVLSFSALKQRNILLIVCPLFIAGK